MNVDFRGWTARALLGVLLVLTGARTGRAEVSFGTMGAVLSAAESLDEEPAAPCSDQELAQLEQSMTATLAATPTDADYTLLLETADGRSYSRSRGASTASDLIQSASTSKLVASVVTLSLVERGFLTLDQRASDLIPWWTTASTNPISRVTLRHLLSFTSGASAVPAPATDMGACLVSFTYEQCAQQAYNLNVDNGVEPGSQFFYSSAHLQLAGLMAINARQAADVSYSSWTAVFNEFKSRTGLFPNSAFDLPTSANPRLSGGMTWTAQDYLAFLRALYRGQLLSTALRTELWANQRGSATVVVSPVVTGLGEDWPYGLGNWTECAPGTNCVSAGRNSSPGAYGAYPFIDFKNGYFGILARQGALGTFPEGAALFRTVQGTAARWATRSCGD